MSTETTTIVIGAFILIILFLTAIIKATNAHERCNEIDDRVDNLFDQVQESFVQSQEKYNTIDRRVDVLFDELNYLDYKSNFPFEFSIGTEILDYTITSRFYTKEKTKAYVCIDKNGIRTNISEKTLLELQEKENKIKTPSIED